MISNLALKKYPLSLQAQTTVKDAKRRFEKLKVDLGEKIDMVSASRCNLLSRSLPNYQKAVLDYNNEAASEFHHLLRNLRMHHHHQYTVRKVLEEIRDLETEEMPFDEALATVDDEFSSLSLPEVKPFPLLKSGDSDEALLDLGSISSSGGGEGAPSSGCGQEGEATVSPKDVKICAQISDLANNPLIKKQQEKGPGEYRRVGDPFSFEKMAHLEKVNDIVLGGIKADLVIPNDEVLQPRGTDHNMARNQGGKDSTSPSCTSSSEHPETEAQIGAMHTSTATEEGEDDIDDLLQLRDCTESVYSQSLPASGADPSSSSTTGQAGAEGPRDSLFSEWNNFSAFMPSTRDDTQNPLAGWEKEFSGTTTISPVRDVSTTPSELKDLIPSSSVDGAGGSAPAVPTSSSVPATADPLQSDPNSAVVRDYSINQSLDMDELLGLGSGSGFGDQNQGMSSSASEILSEELRALDLSPPSTQQLTSCNVESSPLTHSPQLQGSSTGIESINPDMFQMQAKQLHLPPPMQPASSTVYPGMGQPPTMFHSPLGTTQGPPMFPTHRAMGSVMIPPKFGLLAPAVPLSAPGATGGLQLPSYVSAVPVGQRVAGCDADKSDSKDKTGKDKTGKDKGKSWMNFFAHLDPLVNEKA